MSKIKLLLCFISLMMFFTSVYAQQKADTFVVRMLNQKVKVLAPAKYDKNLSVIIENKTIVNLLGKVETGSGKVIEHVVIEPNGFYSVSLKGISKDEKVFFIPMAPAFQRVELVIGRSAYEIPPKR